MNQLCSVCRTVDFGNLFRFPKCAGDKETFANLPYQWKRKDVLSNSSCPFCRILAQSIELHEKEISSRPKAKSAPLLPAVRLMFSSQIQKQNTTLQDDLVIRIRQQSYIQVGREHASSRPTRLNLGFDSEWTDWSCKYSIYDCAPKFICKDGPGMVGGRVINPQNLDVDLARSWIKTCIDDHSSCRGEEQMSKQSLRIRLIDTTRSCIIDAPEDCEYAALSYVWGEAAHHKLKLESSNCGLLQRQGYLAENEHLLSRTVGDAIALCRKLDIRYLWVDSLCIIQDCDDDKGRQLGAMGDIYRNAMVTIVGAAGNDADAGLPRVTTFSQSRALGEEVDGIHMAVLRNDLEPLLNSTWNERGWTFQEMLLSRRLLIFIPDLMLFWCGEAIWRDDIAAESLPTKDVLFTPHSRVDLLRRKPVPSSGNDCLKNYLNLLRRYMPRKFSHEKDRIVALSEVLSEFSPGMGEHIWGIPEGLLWAMLSWSTRRPYGHDQPLERNNKCDDHGNIVELFPSWTWAAWKFPSRGVNIRPNYFRPSHEEPKDSISKSLQVFALDDDGDFRVLFRPKWMLNEYWDYPLEEYTPVDAVDVIKAQHGHHETSTLKRLLFFWTKCVRLRVARHIIQGWQGYKISHSGSQVLVLSKERRRKLPKRIEFVQLGDNLWAPVYSIEGISYRLEPTVCSIREDDIPSYVRLVALG